MTRTLRPYGKDKVAAHVATDTRHLKLLRAAALFEAVYSQAGQVTGYDLVFPVDCRHRLAAILERLKD